MDAYMIGLVVAGGAALGVMVAVLAKLGKALIKIAEALAAAAVVIFAVWLVIKAVGWALRQVLTHWRTSLTVLAGVAWWQWWGGASLAVTCGVVTVVSPGGGWSTSRLLMRGWVGICGPGGCAGRCTPRSCRSGCTPAA